MSSSPADTEVKKKKGLLKKTFLHDFKCGIFLSDQDTYLLVIFVLNTVSHPRNNKTD